jgi:uncharacterized protein YndB with AHSA1/START domain
MANPLQILDIKPAGFQFIEESTINATPKTVWEVVLNPGKWFGFDPDPAKWSKHTFKGEVGGQWIVETPAGTKFLYATIAYMEPGKLIRMSGQFGFSHLPVTCVSIYEFVPQNDGKATLLRVGNRVFGMIDAELETRFRNAWKKLLPNIKAAAEK